MAEQPIPISDISDPTQIRVKLLASNKDVHAPLSAVGAALNTIYNWATVTHAAASKTTPVDADEFSIVDSAASNVIKKVTWANIKATLKTYFDTLYQPLAATLTSWAAITRAAGFDTFVATPSSANLRSLLTDETGTGAAVFAGAPTITGVPIFSGVPSLTGGALTFPATQVPSAGANDLDDYEENSWTAGFSFGSGTTGITYGTRAARYVKIGQLVIAAFDVALTAKGSSTGVAVVTGLPFTSLNDGMIGSLSISFFSGMSGLTGAVTGYVNANGTTAQFVQTGAAATANLTDTSFTNTSRIVGTAIYRAA